MNLELDKNLKYVFIKEKYFEDVLKTQGKLTTIEKNFGHKYDKKRIKVVNPKSGLVDVAEVLQDISGIQFIHFSENDVVRHDLVAAIIRAYEQRDNRIKK